MRTPIPPRGAAIVLSLLLAVPTAIAGQIPEEFENLQVLPEDIQRDSLVGVMRNFALSLGVRCGFCHVMGEDGGFQGARFDLDEKENKEKARFMLHMVDELNDEILPEIPARDDPPTRVECKTCHRGVEKPLLLRHEMRLTLDASGIPAAVERYRELRETMATRGAYDFGEQEMNGLALALAAEGRNAEAIAMLELNEEFHDDSQQIPVLLGQLFERENRTEDAIQAYRRALVRNPDNAFAEQRLEALGGCGGCGT